MRYLTRHIVAPIALALLATAMGHGQEIKDRADKAAVIAAARARLVGDTSAVLRDFTCTLSSRWFTAYYDSVMPGLRSPLFAVRSSDGREPSIFIHDYVKATDSALAESVPQHDRAVEGLLHMAMFAWSAPDKMMLPKEWRDYRVVREPKGYRLYYKDGPDSICTRLSADYKVISLEANSSRGSHILVTPHFSANGGRDRIDSIRLDVRNGEDGKIGFLAMALTYTSVQGREAPAAVTLTAKDFLSMINRDAGFLPIEDTLTFTDYHVTK